MRKKLIVANWKSNKNPKEAVEWLDNLIFNTQHVTLNTDSFEVVICPPYIDLFPLKEKCSMLHVPCSISFGSQDISPFPDGAYTGAVSARQLKGLVSYCLVGHSERRKYFAETTGLVGKKIDLLIASGIKPIICAQTKEEIPQNIKNYSYEQIIIMFEPASAISIGGKYRAEDSMIIEETVAFWRKNLGPYQFLYGGSVNPENCQNLLQTSIEGFVVGNASLDASSFCQILKNV